MPKNKVSDPITDQEIAFARLVLSGAMTDRQAAEAVGLNPDSAAYTKAKPRVRAYILEHRAAVQQQLVQQDVEEQHRLNLDREKVLNRLWELASLGPEMTRGSITGQVKCLAMIAAMQDFIPDRRALSAEKKSAPTSAPPEFYKSAWLREQQATTNDPHPTPALDPKEDQQEEASARPGVPWAAPEPDLPPSSPAELSSRLPRLAVGPERPVPACRGSVVESPALSEVERGPAVPPVPSQPGLAHRVPLADGRPPYVPGFTSVPDTRVPFRIKVNPFKPRR